MKKTVNFIQPYQRLQTLKVKLGLLLIKSYVGVERELHMLTLTLNGEEWLASSFGHFTSWKKNASGTN